VFAAFASATRNGGFETRNMKLQFLLLPLLWAVHSLLYVVTAAVAPSTASFVPQNPPEMKPITNRNSRVHQAAAFFRRGVNLGNFLEVPPGQNWAVTLEASEFAIMRREGFDHVRVPVGWHHYTGPAPDFKLQPEIFGKVDYVVTNALAQKLGVIVNIHHFDPLTSDPAGQTEHFLAIWRQLSAHYAAQPNTLAFELLNEPKDAATTAIMNPIYARAIAEIRKLNPQRTLFVGPGQWNQVQELKNLILPPDDNLIVTIHCYEPFYFTHQGASWAGPDTKVTGIQFPGPPAKPLVPESGLDLRKHVRDWLDRYNTLPTPQNPSGAAAFEGRMKLARAWSDHYGRPIHVGEFGCYTKADADSRARFHAAFRRVLDEQKLGWALWDWSAGFRYWDKKTGEPMPGLQHALFGKTP
jgi:endoglucanase